MAQHTDFTRPWTQKMATRETEVYEFTERERWELVGAENDGRDHFVVVYYPQWYTNGVGMPDEMNGFEVGPFPTSQLAWVAAELEHPGYQDADEYTVPRYQVAGRCLTTGLPVDECEHIPGPFAPTWENMLGPVEDSDLMTERVTPPINQ